MPEFKAHYYPHADLWAGSKRFLRLIEENKKGSLVYYSCISVIVFSAFCLEAYINHMGLIFFPTWSFPKTGEIWKRPKDKLNLICNKVKLSPDFGRRPFQSFSAIFHFRNLIAHAYTISLNGSFTGEPPNTTTEIERKANPKYAKMYHTDTEKIIRGIHKIYDPNDNPFFTIGDADWLG